MSGSLDGKLIVWDCWTGNKIQVDNLHIRMDFEDMEDFKCVCAGDTLEVDVSDVFLRYLTILIFLR